MKPMFKWLSITTATVLICLEAGGVAAHTQLSLEPNAVANVELLAQVGQFPRRPLGNQRWSWRRSGGSPEGLPQATSLQDCAACLNRGY